MIRNLGCKLELKEWMLLSKFWTQTGERPENTWFVVHRRITDSINIHNFTIRNVSELVGLALETLCNVISPEPNDDEGWFYTTFYEHKSGISVNGP